MKKRLISLALCLCMALSLLPAPALAAQDDAQTFAAETQKQEIDTQTYAGLGLTLNDSDVLNGSPTGGQGKEGEKSTLGVQKELYSVGSLSVKEKKGDGSTNILTSGGHTLRDNPLGVNVNDQWTTSLLNPSGSNAHLISGEKGPKVYTAGTRSQSKLLAGTQFADTAPKIRYATLAEFNAGSGKDDHVAELTYFQSGEATLSVYAVNETGRTTGSPLASVRFTDVFGVTKDSAKSDEVYSALFEVSAGDYDGDGKDELAVSYPRATESEDRVLVYEFNANALAAKWALSVGAAVQNSVHQTVSLTSGSLKRNGRDQLFATVSANSAAGGGVSRLSVFDNAETAEYTASLSLRYGAVALGNLKNASESGETTAVIGGFGSGNGTAYRLLRYTGSYRLGGLYTQIAPSADGSHPDKGNGNGAQYQFSVANDELYHAPVGLACAALQGTYAANRSRDAVLLGDRVYVLGDGDALTPGPAPKSTTNYLRLLRTGYVWFDKVLSANLTGDPKGCQQFVTVVGNATRELPASNGTGFQNASVCRGLFLYTYSWAYADPSVMPDKVSDYFADDYLTCGDAISTYLYATESLSGDLSTNADYPFTYTDTFYALCAPDADDDGVTLTLKNSYKVYTDPEVIAVLQSSPYFEDVAQAFPDDYPNQAATDWGQSESEGSGNTTTGTWHAGVYAAAEVQLFVGTEFEIETSYVGSKETVDSTTITQEFAYQTTAGEDSVVVIAVPYMFYSYELTQGGKTTEILSYYPMKVIQSQITVDQYDAIAAVTEGLEPIRGNLLTSEPGDPESYREWPSGSTEIHTPAMTGDVIASSASHNKTISGTVEEEHEETDTHGFEINVKAGAGGALGGNKVVAGVTGGGGAEWSTSTLSSKGTTFSGTVDNLPQGADAYSFTWQISRRTATLNGDNVQLVCYKTTNVQSGVGVPRDPAVDKVTTNAITLSWEPVAEALQYVVYQQDSTGELGAVARVAGAGNDRRQSVTLKNLTANRAYTYQISAVSEAGRGESLLSSAVTGTTLPWNGTLSVLTQPKDQTAYAGSTVTFTVKGSYQNASGEEQPLAYQWFYQDADGKPQRAGNGASLTVTAAKSMDKRQYYCKIYDQYDVSYAITTIAATLSIGKSASATALSGTPGSAATLVTGGTVSEQPTPVVLYGGNVTYTKMTTPGGQAVWSGSDGAYYTHTADGSLPTAAEKLARASGRIYIAGDFADDWAAGGTQTVNGKSITKDSRGLYSYDASGTTVALTAYTVYTTGGTEFSPAQLQTATRQVMTAQAGNALATVALRADVSAADAADYGAVTFTVAAPGVASETLRGTALREGDNTSTASWSPTTPGLYTVTAQYAGDTRYLPSASPAVTYLVVSRTGGDKILTLGADKTSLTYGESVTLTPTLTTTTTTTDGPAVNTTTEHPQVRYTVTRNGAETTETVSDNRFQPAAAGTYVITASYTLSSVTYTASVSVPVSKRQLTIAAENQAAPLNDARPPLTARITGAVNDSDCVQNTHFTLRSDGVTAAAKGDYPIQVSLVGDAVPGSAVTALREKYTIVQTDAVYRLTGTAFPLTVTAGENGAAEIAYEITSAESGTTSRFAAQSGDWIPEGARVTVTAKPARGYQVEKWTDQNGAVTDESGNYLPSETYVIPSFQEAASLSVFFTQEYHTLSFPGSTGGTVTGEYLTGDLSAGSFSSGSKLSVLQTVRLTATPKEGYAIAGWTVKRGEAAPEQLLAADGQSLYTGAAYTVSNVAADTTVTVTFVPKQTYPVTIRFVDQTGAPLSGVTGVRAGEAALTANEAGVYTYTGKTGENLALTVSIPGGLLVDRWTAGAGQLSGALSPDKLTMTLYNLSKAADFTVVCAAPNSYRVSFGHTPAAGGSVSAVKIGASGTPIPDAESMQLQGSALLFTATPAPGYEVSHWTLGGTLVPNTAANQLQIPNLSAAADVVAVFRKLPVITVSGEHVSHSLHVQEAAVTTDYVHFGDQVTVTLTPEEGYRIAEIRKDGAVVTGVGVADSDSRTVLLEDVQADTALSVTAVPLTKYTVSYAVPGGNGTLTASAVRHGAPLADLDGTDTDAITVYEGSSVTLTAAPAADFMVQQWTVDAEVLRDDAHNLITAETLTLSGDTLKTCAVTAAFQSAGETVILFATGVTDPVITDPAAAGTLSAAAAGVTPIESGFVAAKDTRITFTAAPADGWEVEKWTVNGTVQTDENGKPLTASSFDYTVPSGKMGTLTVRAVFLQKAYSVTFDGSVTARDVTDPENVVGVLSGAQVRGGRTLSFAAAAKEGFTLSGWTVNGVSQAQSGALRLTLSKNPGSVTVAPVYTANTLRATFSGDAHGTVAMRGAAASPSDFTAGSSVTFTVTPDANYVLDHWTVTGPAGQALAFTQNGTEITVPNARVNLTVAATTKPAPSQQMTVSYRVAGANGNLTCPVPNGGSVAAGSAVVFTATPNTAFLPDTWTVTGASEADYTVTVSFKAAVQYTVQAGVKNATGGSILYGGSRYTEAVTDGTAKHSVIPGASLSFTAEPAAGQMISGWYVNGVLQEGEQNDVFTTAATANTRVEVAFTAHVSYLVEPQAAHCAIEVHAKNPDYHGADGDFAVHKNGSIVFLVKPEPGFTLKRVTLEQPSAGAGVRRAALNAQAANEVLWTAQLDSAGKPTGSYLVTVRNVTSAYTLNLLCEEAYTVTFTASGNGSVTAAADGRALVSGERVAKGSRIVFTAKPGSGALVGGWTGGGAVSQDKLTYTISALDKNADITVSFQTPGGGGTAIPTYTLTFAVNGGSELKNVSLAAGSAVDLSAYRPVRTGYVFAGWYADPLLTQPVASVTLAANTTVYAKWTRANPFTDVSDDAYYYDAVLWAADKGITSGATATTFAPTACAPARRWSPSCGAPWEAPSRRAPPARLPT